MSAQQPVSLVVPVRNGASCLAACLDQMVPMFERGLLDQILVVDDGSTDNTAEIAESYPAVQLLCSGGRGPGAARNVGWQAARNELVWFIDADCVAEPDALERLLPLMDDPAVGGSGGTYKNMRTDSTLACLIHAEIIGRHDKMDESVNYLAGYNVLFRRDALATVGGFDEHLFNGRGSPGSEDIDLAYRIADAGYTLRFEPASIVGHFHQTALFSYLKTQRHHGYWRVWLYLRHPCRAGGDSYSGIIDHAQPPLAMLALATLPLILVAGLWWIPVVFALILLLLQLPLAVRLSKRTGCWYCMSFVLLGWLRAFSRGVGMTMGVMHAGCLWISGRWHRMQEELRPSGSRQRAASPFPPSQEPSQLNQGGCK